MTAQAIGIIQDLLVKGGNQAAVFLRSKPEGFRILHTVINTIAASFLEQPLHQRLRILRNYAAGILHRFRVRLDAVHHCFPARLKTEKGKRTKYIIKYTALPVHRFYNGARPFNLLPDELMPASQRLHIIKLRHILHFFQCFIGISEITVAHDFDKILIRIPVPLKMRIHTCLPQRLLLRKMKPECAGNVIRLPVFQCCQYSFFLVHYNYPAFSYFKLTVQFLHSYLSPMPAFSSPNSPFRLPLH